MTVHVRRTAPTPTKVFDTYWRFAVERQNIFRRRLEIGSGDWTIDSVLLEYKFTNCYRAADRVSQYLIKEVVYKGNFSPEETVFRTLLFKVFNKIETWELLDEQLGPITAESFNAKRADAILTQAMSAGARIYSAAYIMPNAPKSIPGSAKHTSHLDLLSTLARGRFARSVLETASMGDLYQLLLSIPSFGPFLAYQYTVDLNYGPGLTFSENDFVQPGPGALNGLAKCFSSLGEYTLSTAIAWVTDSQQNNFQRLGLNFQNLWGRDLHLIDCQNLFCEVDKYSRVVHPEFSAMTGRSRIKQKFATAGQLERPWFPPKWGINAAIAADERLARPYGGPVGSLWPGVGNHTP